MSIEKRKQEILDGKKEWTCGEDAGGDHDVFFAEFVKPLRALRSAGMFEDLEEIRVAINGNYAIMFIILKGAVDFNAV